MKRIIRIAGAPAACSGRGEGEALREAEELLRDAILGLRVLNTIGKARSFQQHGGKMVPDWGKPIMERSTELLEEIELFLIRDTKVIQSVAAEVPTVKPESVGLGAKVGATPSFIQEVQSQFDQLSKEEFLDWLLKVREDAEVEVDFEPTFLHVLLNDLDAKASRYHESGDEDDMLAYHAARLAICKVTVLPGERYRHGRFEGLAEARSFAIKMRYAASKALQIKHDDDAAAQFDTADEIAEAIEERMKFLPYSELRWKAEQRVIEAATISEAWRAGYAQAETALFASPTGQGEQRQLQIKVHLEEIKRNTAVYESLRGKECFIFAGDGGCYWKANACGYTDLANAAAYKFEEAYSLTHHCGTEKRIEFHFFDRVAPSVPIRATLEKRAKKWWDSLRPRMDDEAIVRSLVSEFESLLSPPQAAPQREK